MTPYQFYQFFINLNDVEVEQLLTKLTFLELDHISDIMTKHKAQPEQRIAQQELAKELTTLVHGEEGLKQAKGNSESFFTLKLTAEQLNKMSLEDFESHFADTTKTEVQMSDLSTLVNLIHQVQIRKTKADARRLIQQKGCNLNGVLEENDREIQPKDFLYGKYLLLKCGKKHFKLIKIIQ